MEFSIAPLERQRLASLLAAAATLLLLFFALAVALPLIPPKLGDPFGSCPSPQRFAAMAFWPC